MQAARLPPGWFNPRRASDLRKLNLLSQIIEREHAASCLAVAAKISAAIIANPKYDAKQNLPASKKLVEKYRETLLPGSGAADKANMLKTAQKMWELYQRRVREMEQAEENAQPEED